MSIDAVEKEYAENLNVLDGFNTMNLTTFYESGRAVTTPVLFIERNGKIYCWTNEDSYKVKRIQATGKVEVGPSDNRGTVLGAVTKAQARVVEDEVAYKTLIQVMSAKHGFTFHMFRFFGFLMRNKSIFVEVWQ